MDYNDKKQPVFLSLPASHGESKMERQAQFPLFCLRLSIFIVMFVWTLDKIIRPEHGMLVYQKFYHLGNITPSIMMIIGGLEMLILLGFLFGIKKKWTYGSVLVFHLISTVSSFKQYMDPFQGNNLLFFAAIPMLAGCFVLFTLREKDRFFAMDKTRTERRIF